MRTISIRSGFHSLVTMITLIIAVNASAQVMSVGVTSDCDIQIAPDLSTAPLNRAIAAVAAEDQKVFGLALTELKGDLVIDQRSVTVKGGFESCQAASNAGSNGRNTDMSSKTTISGSGSGSVIRIDGGPVQLMTHTTQWAVSPRHVQLDHLIITGGAQADRGGGIHVDGNVHLSVNESEIIRNRAQLGAGLYARGALTKVTLLNTRVAHNTAETDGGGIACGQLANLVVLGNQAIERNEAGQLGGGVLAFNCRVDLQTDVLNNRAGGEGGGIAAVSHATIDIIGERRVIRIEDNQVAFASDEDSMGGGIYLADPNTMMTAENVHIRNNHSGSHGGGLAVIEKAYAVIQRANDHLCQKTDCNLIEGNQIGRAGSKGEGAAAYITDGAVLELIQTRVRRHNADGARSLFYVTRNSAALRIESSLIHSNHMKNEAEHVFKIENRGEVLIALSSVTDNRYQEAAISVNRGTAIAKGNALLGIPDSSMIHVDRPVKVDFDINLFHIGGQDPPVSLGRFVHAGDRIFIDPSSDNFHLNEADATQPIVANQLSDYKPLRREDYAGAARAAHVGNAVTFDIGPNQYSTGTGTPLAQVIRFTEELDQIFQSPRCLNCHAALDVPEVIQELVPHNTLSCTGGCHANEPINLTDWHAPRAQPLHLLTSRQRCNLAKRDVVPGVISGRTHLTDDPLIIWAVTDGALPSNGNAPPAADLNALDWMELVARWFEEGARCD